MCHTYYIPGRVLARQALRTYRQYQSDSPANQARLAAIGISESKFDILFAMGNELTSLAQRTFDNQSSSAPVTAEVAPELRAIIDWRNCAILPRVVSAFEGDVRLRYFRPGRLRSLTASSILREARLLVSALMMFRNDDRMVCVRIGLAEIDKGRELIAAAEKCTPPNAGMRGNRQNVSERICELEDRIHDILGDIERCVSIVFPTDDYALRRYQMHEIHNHLRLNCSGAEMPCAVFIDQSTALREDIVA